MPDLRNQITDADVVDDLCAAMDWLNQDQSIRCAILTGAGKAFSSGGNLKHLRDKESIFGGDAIAVRNSYRPGFKPVAKSVWCVEVPVIAAVNGAAYGAECDLTLFCDIRTASQTAVFTKNFVNVLNDPFFVRHENVLHPKLGNLQEVSQESVHFYKAAQ